MDISEPLMDCNFPEFLAGDLGRSESVFLSQGITAGAPVPLLVDDGSKRRYSLQDSSMEHRSTHSREILSKMKSLKAADRAYSQLFAKNYEPPRRSSDLDSSSSESSGGMIPPSIRTRDVSVTTAATSVTSERFSTESALEFSSPVERVPVGSWMDLGVDDCQTQERKRRDSLGRKTSPPRPLSRRGEVGNLRSMTMGSAATLTEVSDPFAAFSSRMESPTASTFEKPKSVPQQRPPLNHDEQQLSLSELCVSPQSVPTTSHFVLGTTILSTPTRPAPAPPSSKKDGPRESNMKREAMGSTSTSEEVNSISEEGVEYVEDAPPPPSQDESSTPQIVSPFVNWEKWLDSSTDMGFSQHTQSSNDSATSGIPLPPDVLDTLRISVACFPETMLLCSSLSIETIRSHSRKVRFSSSESQLPLTLTDSSPRPSKWKWLTTKKVPDQSRAKLQPRHANSHSEPPSTSMPGGSSQRIDAEWSALKKIFPLGTDYLCDALYAHLLAYNYITLLCPRSAMVAPGPRPSSKASKASSDSSLKTIKSLASDSNKIPRKAASFLGMQNDPSLICMPEPPSVTRTNTIRNKPSFLTGRRTESSKTFSSAVNRSAETNDQSLKELRLGLAKCIARLVATLVLTSEGPTADLTRPVDSKEVDPLLMRALCEIVRCCEER